MVTSFPSLCEELVSQLWGNQWVIPIGSLNSTSTPTSLVIDGGPAGNLRNLAYSSASPNQYDGMGFYTTVGSVVTAPEGEYTKVTRGGFLAAAGRFTISPALSADPNSATGNYLGLFGLTPYDFLNAANDIISTLYLPRQLPLTLVPDGDMEATGVIGWVPLSAAAVTKVTSPATDVLLRRALQVIHAGATQGVESASFPVFPGEQLNVSVALRCQGGTASVTVAVLDGPGGTVVSQVGSTNLSGFNEVFLSYTVPGNQENAVIRVQQNGAGGSGTTFIGWMGVTSSTRAIYNLPTVVDDVNDVTGVAFLPQGQYTGIGALNSILGEYGFGAWPRFADVRDFFGANPNRIQVPGPMANGSLFIRFNAHDVPFTGIDSVSTLGTVIPEEILLSGTLSLLYSQLENQSTDGRAQQKYAQRANEQNRIYQNLKRQIDVSQPYVRQTPAPRVAVPSW